MLWKFEVFDQGGCRRRNVLLEVLRRGSTHTSVSPKFNDIATIRSHYTSTEKAVISAAVDLAVTNIRNNIVASKLSQHILNRDWVVQLRFNQLEVRESTLQEFRFFPRHDWLMKRLSDIPDYPCEGRYAWQLFTVLGSFGRNWQEMLCEIRDIDLRLRGLTLF